MVSLALRKSRVGRIVCPRVDFFISRPVSSGGRIGVEPSCHKREGSTHCLGFSIAFYLRRRSEPLARLYVLETIDLPQVTLFDEIVPRGDVRANRPDIVYNIQASFAEDLLDVELGDLVL